MTDIATGQVLQIDSGWVYPYGTDNPRFKLDNMTILDIKRYTVTGPAFANRNAGAFRKATQSFRLMFKDPCGNFIECPLLPAFTVYTVKYANGATYHYNYQ